MSVTGLDSRQDVLTAATTASKVAKADPSETADAVAIAGAPDFAALLQGRIGRNMALTRADAASNAPERSAASDRAAALADTRRRDPGFDADAPAEPAARRSGTQEHAAPTTEKQRPIAERSADPGAAPDAGANRSRPAAAAAEPGAPRDAAPKATSAPATAAGDAAAGPAKQAAGPAKPAGEPPSPTPTGERAADARAAQATGKPLGDLPAKVQVTQQPQGVASQPQATLGAASAVAAETARAAQQGAKADAPTQETLQSALRAAAMTPGDGAAGQPGAKAGGQNAASPAAQAAKAQAANQVANQAGNQAAATGQSPGAETPQPTPSFATGRPGAHGLQTAPDSGGRFAALTGTGKPMVAADPMTGGALSTGQNNAVQQRSAPAPTGQTARQTPPPPLSDQIAVQIQRAAGTGSDRIQIQLKPAELGRVEVRLEMAHDGRMTAVVTAERAETLDLLRQDARQLLQTLNDAGLKADQQSLSFNLRGDQGAGDRGDAHGRASDDAPGELVEGDGAVDPFAGADGLAGFGPDGRLNLRV